jgi:hypothetical protein
MPVLDRHHGWGNLPVELFRIHGTIESRVDSAEFSRQFGSLGEAIDSGVSGNQRAAQDIEVRGHLLAGVTRFSLGHGPERKNLNELAALTPSLSWQLGTARGWSRATATLLI